MINIPRWKCHKEVYAFKIEQIKNQFETNDALLINNDISVKVDIDYLGKHKPEVGGYYVLYDDGYQSFSPAKAFEDGYTEIK